MKKQAMCAVLIAMVLTLVLAGSASGGFNADKDPSLVGLWRLDDGAGMTAADSSPNGNHGALQGDPQWIEGMIGGALELDGDGDYVNCGNDAVFDITEQITLAIWVNANDLGNGQHNCWLGKGDNAYAIKHQSGNFIEFFVYDGDWNATEYRDGLESLNGEWHHMAGTFDGTQLVFYLDGQKGTELALETTISTATHDVTLGENSQATGRFLDGMLDDARIYNRALTQEEIQIVMLGGVAPELASEPIPEDEAIDVPRDDDMSWTPGEFAASHDVYLGTVFDDVNDASRADPRGVLVSEAQGAAAYDPGRLEFGQTYYWRIDEVNAAPDSTIFKGLTWSFTVEPFAYPVQNIIATSNATSEATAGPENTVNGSGLNANDEHSTNATDMWLGRPGDGPVTLEYEFDNVYKLHEMLVWNYNVQFELLLGFGLKDVTIETSEDGVDWTVLGDVVIAQATASETYGANTTIAFDGIAAKYVRLTINSGHGMTGQFGLSEVRFLYIPVQARQPQPADGEVGVSVATSLAWRAGRQAASHDVYIAADSETLTLAGAVDAPTFAPDVLDLETTYYWKVDEVNTAEEVTTWASAIWSFTTESFIVVEDFEGYDDDENRIYQSWVDGYGVDTNGSTVGHLESPFAERSIVHGGDQSMPLFYDNSDAPLSEAQLALTQDWTASKVATLSLYFQGAEGNTGQLYVKINGVKIPYPGDAADIAGVDWLAWTIDLSTVGGDLSAVTSLTIGIEGAGASGVIYVDDIELHL